MPLGAPLLQQMRIKPLAIVVFLLVGACGPAGQLQGSASPSRGASPQTPLPTPSSGPVSTALFAIATGLPGGQLVAFSPTPGQATVKIVGADGAVHAQASFVPPPAPA